MNGSEWKEVIKKLGIQELKDYRDALRTLRTWHEFNNGFHALSLIMLESFLTNEIKTRISTKD